MKHNTRVGGEICIASNIVCVGEIQIERLVDLAKNKDVWVYSVRLDNCILHFTSHVHWVRHTYRYFLIAIAQLREPATTAETARFESMFFRS